MSNFTISGWGLSNPRKDIFDTRKGEFHGCDNDRCQHSSHDEGTTINTLVSSKPIELLDSDVDNDGYETALYRVGGVIFKYTKAQHRHARMVVLYE